MDQNYTSGPYSCGSYQENSCATAQNTVTSSPGYSSLAGSGDNVLLLVIVAVLCISTGITLTVRRLRAAKH